MNQKTFMSFFIALFLLGTQSNALAENGELGDESWTVEERIGRYFYFTHGTAVWGHEFGFFKDPNECNADTIWLTFSSSEEKVKNYIGSAEKRFRVIYRPRNILATVIFDSSLGFQLTRAKAIFKFLARNPNLTHISLPSG